MDPPSSTTQALRWTGVRGGAGLAFVSLPTSARIVFVFYEPIRGSPAGGGPRRISAVRRHAPKPVARRSAGRGPGPSAPERAASGSLRDPSSRPAGPAPRAPAYPASRSRISTSSPTPPTIWPPCAKSTAPAKSCSAHSVWRRTPRRSPDAAGLGASVAAARVRLPGCAGRVGESLAARQGWCPPVRRRSLDDHPPPDPEPNAVRTPSPPTAWGRCAAVKGSLRRPGRLRVGVRFTTRLRTTALASPTPVQASENRGFRQLTRQVNFEEAEDPPSEGRV